MADPPPLLPRAPHGGPDARPFAGLDFSVNANPYGPNPLLVRALREADHAHYPDPTYAAVRARLGAWHGRAADEVALAVGASDLLHRLVRALVFPGDRVLSVRVPFGEFARAVALARGRVEVLSGVPEMVPPGTPLVYVGQPHNPSGHAQTAGDLHRLAHACRGAGALLIVDEAYAPFTGAPVPQRHPAVLRLCSPGKAHGLVGARPAYALAAPEVVARLENLAPAWHLPAGTAAVLGALPDADAFLAWTRPLVARAAGDLAARLSALGRVEHHGTPFLTLEVGNARRVTADLLERGVRVRDCTSYGHPDRIRVSTRTPEENARLLEALEQVQTGGTYG